MRRSVKMTLRMSEIRQKLNELLAIEERSADQTSEMETLTGEAQRLEPELRAALVAEESEQRQAAENFQDGQRPEDRELRSLIDGARLADVVEGVVERRATDGRTAELQGHLGLHSGQVPLELLRIEDRAVTPAPTNTGASQAEIVQPVFAMGDLAFLNVRQEVVPAGDAVFPVLTTRPTVKTHDDSTSVDETTGAFTAVNLAPQRTQASFFFRRQDGVRFAGMEDALRQALSSALSEELDKLFMAEMVKAANMGGLGPATDLGSGKADFAALKTLAGGQVDGRFAGSKMDVRILMGSHTYGFADGTYSSAGDLSAVSCLETESGGVRVSPHVAAMASKKQDAFIRLGMRRDAVVPTWNGIDLIFDEITKAATGEIVLTAVLMNNRAILRTGGFKRLAVQTS